MRDRLRQMVVFALPFERVQQWGNADGVLRTRLGPSVGQGGDNLEAIGNARFATKTWSGLRHEVQPNASYGSGTWWEAAVVTGTIARFAMQ